MKRYNCVVFFLLPKTGLTANYSREYYKKAPHAKNMESKWKQFSDSV